MQDRRFVFCNGNLEGIGRPLNIVVIGRSLPQTNSSYGKFEYEQALALSKRGHRVCYLFSDNRSIKEIRSIERIDEVRDGIRIVGSAAPYGGAPYRLFDRLKSRSLVRAFSEIDSSYMKPDVVYAHFPLIAMTPTFFDELVKQRIPVVTMEHWSKVKNKALDRGRRLFLKRITDDARAVCCVSDDLATAISDLTGKSKQEIAVIPNPVNPELFYAKEGERHSSVIRFIWSGRLEKSKSVDLIIRALSAADYPWELVIAGTGSEEHSLKRLASDLGIAKKIKFNGWVASDELGELYRESDFFISANADETFCVPFAEAWMCGLPCVGAASNPLRRFFTEWNGVLFEDGCIESLRNQLEYARGHKSLFCSNVIANWAKEHFSTVEVMLQVENALSVATEKACLSEGSAQ